MTWAKPLGVFAALAGVSLLLRFPFISFAAPVGWDENTFFLVASRGAAGELPYTTTFDNKPPLAVLFQTMALATRIDSPWQLRIVAAILAALAAYFLTRIGFRRGPSWWQVPTGAIFIALYSLLPEGFGWVTELNAIVLFALAIYLLWRIAVGQRASLFLLGLVIGLLPLTRTNWAFVAIALLVAAALYVRGMSLNFVRGVTALIAGSATPLALTALAYAGAGEFSRFWQGAVLLPLRYGVEATDASSLSLSPYSLRLWLIGMALIALAAVLSWYLGQIEELIFDGLVALIASVLLITALAQSPDYGHHALQFTPIIAIGLARVTGQILQMPWAQPVTLAATGAVIVLALFGLPLSNYYQGWTSLKQAYTPSNFSNFAREITSDSRTNLGEVGVSALASVQSLVSKDQGSIWALDTHDIYWRLGKDPVSPLVTHPSSLVEPAFLRTYFGAQVSPEQAVIKTFDLSPDLIVFESAAYLTGAPKARFDQLLNADYQKRFHLGAHPGVQVWVRRGYTPPAG